MRCILTGTGPNKYRPHADHRVLIHRRTPTLRGGDVLWSRTHKIHWNWIVQVYASTSKVFGGYGNPWDARIGVNWFPWKVQELRWNFEYIQLDRSPVGGLSLPYPVGGTGPVFHSNFEVNF